MPVRCNIAAMKRVIGSILVAATAFGCGTTTSPATPPPAPEPAETPGPSVPTLAAGWTEADPGTTPLVVTPDHIALGESAPILRLTAGAVAAADVRGGEHGFLVPPVQEAVGAITPSSTAITIAVDPAVPYQTVTRVVYSAGQASRSTMHFAVRVGGARRVVPVELP